MKRNVTCLNDCYPTQSFIYVFLIGNGSIYLKDSDFATSKMNLLVFGKTKNMIEFEQIRASMNDRWECVHLWLIGPDNSSNSIELVREILIGKYSSRFIDETELNFAGLNRVLPDQEKLLVPSDMLDDFIYKKQHFIDWTTKTLFKSAYERGEKVLRPSFSSDVNLVLHSIYSVVYEYLDLLSDEDDTVLFIRPENTELVLEEMDLLNGFESTSNKDHSTLGYNIIVRERFPDDDMIEVNVNSPTTIMYIFRYDEKESNETFDIVKKVEIFGEPTWAIGIRKKVIMTNTLIFKQ
ncbi:predicted protein [Naegleria gruberi]|uniref:Predicted protein n=1 Tax=Naegleria gruberi TaxID=5762 RepID=D2VJU1_NAEGR|nr:uncharacterized protein NAEGRDRAFT_50135 [Naegleria gruberi]EFC42747.1 predicted protein [Naegleria gruberi]|eukprot:XP_002675491.1 predicted protein [Naegleria gruberi strain NEG-M]